MAMNQDVIEDLIAVTFAAGITPQDIEAFLAEGGATAGSDQIVKQPTVVGPGKAVVPTERDAKPGTGQDVPLDLEQILEIINQLPANKREKYLENIIKQQFELRKGGKPAVALAGEAHKGGGDYEDEVVHDVPGFDEGGVTVPEEEDPLAGFFEEGDDDEIKEAIRKADQIARQQTFKGIDRDQATRTRQQILDTRTGATKPIVNPEQPPNAAPAVSPTPAPAPSPAAQPATYTVNTVGGGRNPKDWRFDLPTSTWVPRNPPAGAAGPGQALDPATGNIDLVALHDYIDPEQLYPGVSPEMARVLHAAGPGRAAGMFGANTDEGNAQMDSQLNEVRAGYTNATVGKREMPYNQPFTPDQQRIQDGQPGAGGYPLGMRANNDGTITDRQGNPLPSNDARQIADGQPGAGNMELGLRESPEGMVDRNGTLVYKYDDQGRLVRVTPATGGNNAGSAAAGPGAIPGGSPAGGGVPAGGTANLGNGTNGAGPQGGGGQAAVPQSSDEELIDIPGLGKVPLSQARGFLADLDGGNNTYEKDKAAREAAIKAGTLKPTMDDRAILNQLPVPPVNQVVTAPKTGATFEFRKGENGLYELWYPQMPDGFKEGDTNNGEPVKPVMVKVNQDMDITDTKKLFAFLQGGDWGVRDNPAYNPQPKDDLRTKIEMSGDHQSSIRNALAFYDSDAGWNQRYQSLLQKDPAERQRLAEALVKGGQLQIDPKEFQLPREQVIVTNDQGREQFKDGTKLVQRLDDGSGPITHAILEIDGKRWEYVQGQPTLRLVGADGQTVGGTQAPKVDTPAPLTADSPKQAPKPDAKPPETRGKLKGSASTEPRQAPDKRIAVDQAKPEGKKLKYDTGYGVRVAATNQTEAGFEVFEAEDGTYWWKDADGTWKVYPAGQKPKFDR